MTPTVPTTPAQKVSVVVLQSTFLYAANTLTEDAHTLSTGGHNATFFVYNFGAEARRGNITVTSTMQATVKPGAWHEVHVEAHGRAQIHTAITPPSARAWLDGGERTGTVTLVGDFGEGAGAHVVPPTLYFRVIPDMKTATPSLESAITGATTPSSWIHNIASGGTVGVATDTANPNCVHFTLKFGSGVTDAWAYPELAFNSTDAPAQGIDGIRFSISSLHTSPPATPPPMHRVIFFDRLGAQYDIATSVNATDTAGQEITVLLKDAAWNGNGPRPTESHERIAASGVVKLAIGLNMVQPTGHTTEMSVCALRWVRF
jgi:hypothetical protein